MCRFTLRLFAPPFGLGAILRDIWFSEVGGGGVAFFPTTREISHNITTLENTEWITVPDDAPRVDTIEDFRDAWALQERSQIEAKSREAAARQIESDSDAAQIASTGSSSTSERNTAPEVSLTPAMRRAAKELGIPEATYAKYRARL